MCKEYLHDINDFTINIPNKQDDDLGKEYIESFNESNYSTVINNFYSIDNTNYDSISLYILTSISYLLIGEHPEPSESVIYCMIVELMFTVLKRNEQEAINAIYRLAAIARLLRTFAFHKGISVFLRLVANFDLGYDIEQLYSTSIDNTFKSYIDNSNNLSIMPFASKIKNYDYDIISNYLKQYNSHNIQGYNEISQIYFKECFVSLCLERLYNANIEEATNLLVNSFIENKLLVYTVEVKPIIEYISKKYKEATIDPTQPYDDIPTTEDAQKNNGNGNTEVDNSNKEAKKKKQTKVALISFGVITGIVLVSLVFIIPVLKHKNNSLNKI